MTTETVQERITPQWLLARGWYITEAAKAIGRDPSHVRRVLIGDPRCHEIGVQLGELGGQWVPVDAEKFYTWLRDTPGLKWEDVVDMLARKLRKTKQQRKRTNDQV